MSQEGYNKLLDRFHADPAFREQLKTNLNQVLSGYDLTEEEKRIIQENLGIKTENYAMKVLKEIWDKHKDDLLPR